LDFPDFKIHNTQVLCTTNSRPPLIYFELKPYLLRVITRTARGRLRVTQSLHIKTSPEPQTTLCKCTTTPATYSNLHQLLQDANQSLNLITTSNINLCSLKTDSGKKLNNNLEKLQPKHANLKPHCLPQFSDQHLLSPPLSPVNI
jgi:hypothetical protein